MIDAPGVERRRAPLDAVDLVTLVKQQLGQISAILAGRAGDQCRPVGHLASAPKVRSRIGPARAQVITNGVPIHRTATIAV